MKSSASLSLRRLLGYFSGDDPTAQFLKERQARVTVEETDKKGFYVVLLKPRTDINVREFNLRILAKYAEDRTLSLTVRDLAARKTIININAPVDSGAGVLNVDYHEVHLRLDFDAERDSS